MNDDPGRSPPRTTGFPRHPGAGVGASEFAGAGVQLAATIVVFMFLGIWLDRTLHSSPWLLLICVFAGAGAGFYSIYRKLMDAQRRSDGTRTEKKGGS